MVSTRATATREAGKTRRVTARQAEVIRQAKMTAIQVDFKEGDAKGKHKAEDVAATEGLALEDATQKTPVAARIMKYDLPSPKTPCRRLPFKLQVTAVDELTEGQGESSEPLIRPCTPSTPRFAGNVFTRARQALSRSADAPALIGRTKEREELKTFFQSTFRQDSSHDKQSCLYISGNPGTGKTALVTSMATEMIEPSQTKLVIINCVELITPIALFQILCSRLNIACTSGQSPKQALEGYLQSSEANQTLVILDEIDHLLATTLEHAALYDVFAWPFRFKNRFGLIGIANTLDLTRRFLPRLKVDGHQPQLMHFGTYSVADVAAIIRGRLQIFQQKENMDQAGSPFQITSVLPFFQNPALQLCAQKIASSTGDLRKALDVCKAIISLLEEETKNKIMTKLESIEQASVAPFTPPDTPTKRGLALNGLQPIAIAEVVRTKMAELTCETAPKATPAHVVRVCKMIFSNSAADALRLSSKPTETAHCASRRLGGLSLQPRLVLLSILLVKEEYRDPVEQGGSSPMKRSLSNLSNSSSTSQGPDSSISGIFARYQRLLKDHHHVAHAVTRSEFADLLTVLESSGLITQAKKSSRSTDNSIDLGISAAETTSGLENVAIVGELLKFEMGRAEKERTTRLMCLGWERESKRLHLDQIQSHHAHANLDQALGRKSHLVSVSADDQGLTTSSRGLL